jgi:hypothetical protein
LCWPHATGSGTVARMTDDDRFELLGAYRTPSARIGSWRKCMVRGEVRVVGYKDGPIPWPLGQRKGHSATMHIVYGDLARAIRPASPTRPSSTGSGHVCRRSADGGRPST